MPRKLCPNCRQDSVQLHLGGLAGMWNCNNCGYFGPVVLEEEITAENKGKSKKHK